MSIAHSDLAVGAGQPLGQRPDQDRKAVEEALMLARRRAEGCSPGGPSWDAAMGLVDDLERAMLQFEDTPEPAQISQWIGSSSPR